MMYVRYIPVKTIGKIPVKVSERLCLRFANQNRLALVTSLWATDTRNCALLLSLSLLILDDHNRKSSVVKWRA